MIFQEPKWESEHAVALRDFLQTEAGQLFLDRLQYLRPGFPSKESTARLIDSGVVEGYEKAMENIATMLVESKPIEEHPDTAYPDLDNDAAWVGTPQGGTTNES